MTKPNKNFESVDTDELKNVYDSIVTPSDDLATIVSNATAGESIWVAPGTHTVSLDGNSEALPIEQDDITLYLAGGATVQLADGETSASTTGGGLVVATAGVSGATITGPGTLDGNKSNNTTPSSINGFALIRAGNNVTDLRISDLTIQNSPADAILPSASSGNEIQRVWVENCTITDNAEGIYWNYADDVIIRDNAIDNTTAQDGVEPVQSSDWEITNNIIRNTAQSAIDVFNGAVDGIISENIIRGAGSVAINIEGSPANTDIEIHDNQITGGSSNGIGVAATAAHEDINIHDNRIEDAGGDGVNVISNTLRVDVKSNTMVSCGDRGIYHQGDDCVIALNRCLNNGQSGSDRGIRAGGDHQDIKNNVCYDTQATATQQYGIQAGGSSQFVHGNHCWDNGTSDLLDQTDADSVVSDNMTT